jgi:hypothetical protein
VIYLRRPWIVDFPPEGSWRAVLPEMGRADVDVGVGNRKEEIALPK